LSTSPKNPMLPACHACLPVTSASMHWADR
jgi:hypothetical protein